MLVLPEIQIEKILLNGFEQLKAMPNMLDDLLANYPEKMRVEAKKYLSEHTVSVVLNWPREGHTLPVVAIINNGDAEAPDKDVLNDFLEQEFLSENDLEEKEQFGVAKNGVYNLFCNSQDPRLTLYICIFVETLMILNTNALQEAGMHNILLGSGDLQFNEAMLPEWVNARVVSVSCLHYHAVQVSSLLYDQLVVNTTT